MVFEIYKSPIVVTNATGYVESWIVSKLLQQNKFVRAIVPNFSDPKQVDRLKQLDDINCGRLEVFIVDPLQKDAYDKLLSESELVFQSTPTFSATYTDAYSDIFQPELVATRYFLHEVNKTKSVKRVVHTSSVNAIYGDACDISHYPNKIATENDWNTSSDYYQNPRKSSKTNCEKEAWRMANKQTQWDLITINPSISVGPSICSAGESCIYQIINNLIHQGNSIRIPSIQLPVVDVRDVADAHIKAAFEKKAEGRYIISASKLSIKEISNLLKDCGLLISTKTTVIPNFLSPYLCTPLGFSKEELKDNCGYTIDIDNHKAKDKLGMKYRSVRESLIEYINQNYSNTTKFDTAL